MEKAKQAAAANQALLINGEAPNSPTHSSIHSSNQGSNNLVFAEGGGSLSLSPTASPTRRDYILTKGVGGHPTVDAMKKKRSRQKEGRQVAAQIESPSRRSSQSSLSHKGARSPTSIPSPYGINAKSGDFLHDPAAFQNPVDVDRRYRKKEHRHGRHKSPTSPNHPTGSERSHSPGALSSGSRTDSRNQSFKKAISNRGNGGVPLADEEDLSPTSPVTPTQEQIGFAPRAHTPGRPGETIPMGDYDRRTRNRFRDSGIADTHIGSPESNPKQTLLPSSTEPRPPVEGRDSLRRKDTPPYTATTPDRQNANYLPDQRKPPNFIGRPEVKPLPLRDVQRPDGQSPEHTTEDPNANAHTPNSVDLSPILQKTKLFNDNDSKSNSAAHTPDTFTQPDFEYDDYVPDLPGSYFTMDPGAYTLTWSQAPPWHPPQKVQPAASQESVPRESNA